MNDITVVRNDIDKVQPRSTRLTYAGMTLLAKCQTGQRLHFTRVAMGDGILPEGQEIRDLTDLISPQFDLPIKAVTVTGVGTTLLETELKNANLEKCFKAREVGIFAMDGETEILYAVRNTGEDSEYIPAGGGPEIWDMIYDIVTVVDQATNITANINGSVAYVTRIEFYDYRDKHAAIHAAMPQLKEAVTETNTLWVQKDNDNHLHPMPVHEAQRVILGGEASTIPSLKGRLTQLEREQANISLALTAQQIYPDYNMLLSEDFIVPDKIDTFACKVLSVVAGDNGIDVETLSGIVPGAWYTITDGVNQEYFQIQSCIKNGSVFRILANKNLSNTYKIDETLILRSTAEIGAGVVYGSGDKKGFNWSPSLIWQGVESNVATTIKLETTQEKADEFIISGEIAFTGSGFITLSTD